MSAREREIYEIFAKHMAVLERAYQQDLDNEFIISGIIYKCFIQFELGWKLLKELLKHEEKAVGVILEVYIPELRRLLEGTEERYGKELRQM